jgi:hypothetical protein
MKGKPRIMMTRRIKVLGLTVAAAVSLSFAAYSNDCLEFGVDAFTKPTRPFVCFVHDTHNETAGIDDCAVCHHVYSDGKLVEGESSEDQTCAECHARENDVKQLELMTRFHERCRGCHLERKNGPITCGECHKKDK